MKLIWSTVAEESKQLCVDLHSALKSCDADQLRELVSIPETDVNATWIEKGHAYRPVLYAAKKGDATAVKILLERDDLNFRQIDQDGR